MDLAEFASFNSVEERRLPVAVGRAVTAAVGEPQLRVTVECAWSKGGPSRYARRSETHKP